MIVRRINDEPFDVPSVPGSRAVTIKFMIPNSRMGSVIGKSGSKIKEIQDASGARLNASEGMLPGSTEVLSPYNCVLYRTYIHYFLAASTECSRCSRCYPYCNILHWKHPHRGPRTHAIFYQFFLSPFILLSSTSQQLIARWFLIRSRLLQPVRLGSSTATANPR